MKRTGRLHEIHGFCSRHRSRSITSNRFPLKKRYFLDTYSFGLLARWCCWAIGAVIDRRSLLPGNGPLWRSIWRGTKKWIKNVVKVELNQHEQLSLAWWSAQHPIINISEMAMRNEEWEMRKNNMSLARYTRQEDALHGLGTHATVGWASGTSRFSELTVERLILHEI